MPISYNEQRRVFRLDTPHTTYLMGLVGSENFLGHIYYGPSVPDDNMEYLLRLRRAPLRRTATPGSGLPSTTASPSSTPPGAAGTFASPACG